MNVALLDQQHAARVEFAVANQILLVPNVQTVRQAILVFPTAKVKHFKNQILEKELRIFKSFSACGCSSSGSSSTTCSSSGVCSCKSNIVGTKCTACNTDYFGFPNCKGKTFLQKLNS